MELERFSGVDTRGFCKDSLGSSDVRNFEILHDGSLQKRCGYGVFASFNEPIRAFWSGNIGGEQVAYLLSGNTVLSLSPQTREQRVIGEIEDSESADIFCYRGRVYLINGVGLYEICENGLRVPYGYVPLVGKDWPDLELGEINEPRNILSDKGRITYLITETASSTLKTDAPISSIEAVYVNGILRSPDTYFIAGYPRTVSVTGLKEGDRVELHYTYAEKSAYLADLLSNTHAIVFGGVSNTRPFLWGGTNKAMMYSCSHVSGHSLAASLLSDPESDALYFPEGYEFEVGDGRCPVMSVSRHYDRLLIFTEEGAWAANDSSCGLEDVPTLNVNSSYGVATQGASDILGNQPCTVGAHSIMRWTADTDELDECNAYSIDEPIRSLLPPEFFTSAHVFADKPRSRLLFCSDSLDGDVWAYYEDGGRWVCFTGVYAERFIDLDGTLGFIRGNVIYAFDEAATLDEGEREIVGVFKGNLADLGTPLRKRLSFVTLSHEGGDVRLSLTLDGLPAETLSFGADERHTTVRKRITSRRFSTLQACLVAEGEARQRIHSLKFEIN